ncbi:Uncharacterised protein [Klebsiella michiganensis]|uniref:Uncharacterized protein n=1 Tax=Klebsiella michiganensis TaxID=1134687 RepID=A0A7H4MUB4_9ENTR|nr:Uncharacterised protein [Klebsiella michiganensis]
MSNLKLHTITNCIAHGIVISYDSIFVQSMKLFPYFFRP